MLVERQATPIPGCCELRPRVFGDARGVFVKTFNRERFAELGLCADWAEQYYSVSRRNVLRGLHFQLPPADHAKLVYCTAGEVMDVALDLRRGSPTEGRWFALRLSAAAGNMLYLPSGLAHGFYTLSESATLVYNVSSGHSPAHDSGIRWDSAGIDWPLAAGVPPELSERDRGLVALADFASPFVFDPADPACAARC